jgi:hypothetical protein
LQIQDRTFRECRRGAALLLVATALAGLGSPASAQTPSPAGGGGPGWGLFQPLPPADTGKPLIFDAPARLVEPTPPSDCAMLLSCRARLLGTNGRGGAVELEVTPFSW